MIILEPGQSSYESWRILLGLSSSELEYVDGVWVYYESISNFVTLDGHYFKVTAPELSGVQPGDYTIAFEIVFQIWWLPSIWYVQIIRVLPPPAIQEEVVPNVPDVTD